MFRARDYTRAAAELLEHASTASGMLDAAARGGGARPWVAADPGRCDGSRSLRRNPAASLNVSRLGFQLVDQAISPPVLRGAIVHAGRHSPVFTKGQPRALLRCRFLRKLR